MYMDRADLHQADNQMGPPCKTASGGSKPSTLGFAEASVSTGDLNVLSG
jgi:hypothetical protein